MQFRNPGIIIGTRTDRCIQLIMIGNVIAVQAFRARLKIRRSVDVGYAERVQIRDDGACLVESEPAIELQPVCADWNAWLCRLCHVIPSECEGPLTDKLTSHFINA